MKKILLAFLIAILVILLGHTLGYFSLIEEDAEKSIDNKYIVYNTSLVSYENREIELNKIELNNWYETDNTEYSSDNYILLLLSSDGDILYKNTFTNALKNDTKFNIYIPYNPNASKLYIYDKEGMNIIDYNLTDVNMQYKVSYLDIDGIIKFLTLFMIVLISGLCFGMIKQRKRKTK